MGKVCESRDSEGSLESRGRFEVRRFGRSRCLIFDRLCLAVESFKVGNWIGVASLFRNRTDVQCRERWCNILDPKLNGREWTKEEDELLVKAVMDHGKKWAKVSRMV